MGGSRAVAALGCHPRRQHRSTISPETLLLLCPTDEAAYIQSINVLCAPRNRRHAHFQPDPKPPRKSLSSLTPYAKPALNRLKRWQRRRARWWRFVEPPSWTRRPGRPPPYPSARQTHRRCGTASCPAPRSTSCRPRACRARRLRAGVSKYWRRPRWAPITRERLSSKTPSGAWGGGIRSRCRMVTSCMKGMSSCAR